MKPDVLKLCRETSFLGHIVQRHKAVTDLAKAEVLRKLAHPGRRSTASWGRSLITGASARTCTGPGGEGDLHQGGLRRWFQEPDPASAPGPAPRPDPGPVPEPELPSPLTVSRGRSRVKLPRRGMRPCRAPAWLVDFENARTASGNAVYTAS